MMCEECERLKKIIRKAIDSSIPYVAQYNAFMISTDAWDELAKSVNPAIAKLDALLVKIGRGEKPTEDEIREALS
jgi:hypothetical protein